MPTPTFTLNSNATTVVSGEFINLTGVLSIPETGTVTFYWSINSPSFGYEHDEIITNGVFTRSFGCGPPSGTWRFRVYWSGDAATAPAESNIITVTVT